MDSGFLRINQVKMAPNLQGNYTKFVRQLGEKIDVNTGEILEKKCPWPPGREEDGQGDLTLLNKVTGNSYITVLNRDTGEFLTVDQREARKRRCRKRVLAWANTMKSYINNPKFRMVMIGLTYRPGVEWRANDVRDFIAQLKRIVGKGNIVAIARVAELQARGAVHYHIIIIAKKGAKIPYPDKYGLWLHGSTRVEAARSPFYLVSYTKKSYQKDGIFPKGIRMYEVWINPDYVGYLDRWLFRLSSLPGWFERVVREDVENIGRKWVRLKGGGWSFADRIYKSPFVFIKIEYA